MLWTKSWIDEETQSSMYSDVLSAGFNDGEQFITLTPYGEGKMFTSQVVYLKVEKPTNESPPETEHQSQPQPLTLGPTWATELLFWDRDQQLIYYIAAPHARPGERHLYRCSTNPKKPDIRYCMTCPNENLSEEAMETWPECSYSAVTFSPQGSYYLLDCLEGIGADFMPRTMIVKRDNNKVVKLLDDRGPEYDWMLKFLEPEYRYLECPIANRKYKARIKVMLPAYFTPNKQYPLILGVDSRIGSQQVSRKWFFGIGYYTAVTKNYIYAMADVRGSGFQGYQFESELYKKAGGPEVDDLLDVIKFLIRNMTYIDREEVYVQGEQYGGMVAILMLLKNSKLIKAAAAYHPPLYWVGCTAFFAERNLGLPTIHDNYLGYEASSIGERVYRYQEEKVLIVMDMERASAGYSHQLFMLRNTISQEPYIFNFTNVVELYYGADNKRGSHRLLYYRMMLRYFEMFMEDKYITKRTEYYEGPNE